ncbi:MAG: outer membrane beta-barrel protein [candidate division Zixibacteria bacterium]|nr:outer membrane beta-barrel protein [candidate division Zixibacteria bacterium]
MRRCIWVILAALLILSLRAETSAETLKGRSRLGIDLRLADHGTSSVYTTIGMGTVRTEAGSSGMGGGVSYGYWIQENLAFSVSISGLTTEVDTEIDGGTVSSQTVVVAPILVGVRYYAPNSALTTDWRPYVTASGGPYIASQSKTEVGLEIVNEERTETAIGAYLGAGLDVRVSRYFLFGTGLGYHFVGAFSEEIGGRTDYSGAEFSLSVSLLFGGHR